MEQFITGTGQRLWVHEVSKCAGEFCVIHNPSDHHMRGWPLHWREDRRLFERIDPMGAGHPDPDDLNYHYKKDSATTKGVHGCNGLCNPELYKKYLGGSMSKIHDFASVLNCELPLRFTAVPKADRVILYKDDDFTESIYVFMRQEIEADYKACIDLLMDLLDLWEE